MTIIARYAGRCASCGQPITPGQPIEWVRGMPPRHAACMPASARRPVPTRPTPALSSAPGLGARRQAPREPAPGETKIYRDTAPYTVGATVLVDRQTWRVVTVCGQYRISQYEDDTREGETRYWAYARLATDEEGATAQAARDGRQAAKDARVAALRVLHAGESMGRDWRTPAGSTTIAREPQAGSLASKDTVIATPDGTVYVIDPVYDDDPRVGRLALTVEQAIATARIAGWGVEDVT